MPRIQIDTDRGVPDYLPGHHPVRLRGRSIEGRRLASGHPDHEAHRPRSAGHGPVRLAEFPIYRLDIAPSADGITGAVLPDADRTTV